MKKKQFLLHLGILLWITLAIATHAANPNDYYDEGDSIPNQTWNVPATETCANGSYWQLKPDKVTIIVNTNKDSNVTYTNVSMIQDAITVNGIKVNRIGSPGNDTLTIYPRFEITFDWVEYHAVVRSGQVVLVNPDDYSQELPNSNGKYQSFMSQPGTSIKYYVDIESKNEVSDPNAANYALLFIEKTEVHLGNARQFKLRRMVTDLTLGDAAILLGGTKTLDYLLTPPDAYDKKVVNWKSSDTSVATVNQDAIVQASTTKPGTTTISAKSQGQTKAGGQIDVTSRVQVYKPSFGTPVAISGAWVDGNTLYYNNHSTSSFKIPIEGIPAVAAPPAISINTKGDFTANINASEIIVNQINRSKGADTYTVSFTADGTTLNVPITLTLNRVVDSLEYDSTSADNVVLFPAGDSSPANTYTYKTQLRPTDAYDTTVNWTTVPAGIVTLGANANVNRSGYVENATTATAIQKGITKVKATANGKDINRGNLFVEKTLHVIDIAPIRPTAANLSSISTNVFMGTNGISNASTPGNVIYYQTNAPGKSNTVVYMEVNVLKDNATTLTPSFMNFAVNTTDFTSTEHIANGKYYLKMENFKGNVIDKTYTLNARYEDTNTNVTATTTKTFTLSFRRVVDSLKMPNDSKSSQPMIVFKGDTIDVKSRLQPIQTTSTTLAYHPYVTWGQSADSNISIDAKYKNANNMDGESVGVDSYISILPVNGNVVGQSTVTAKAEGIDISGSNQSVAMGVSVIDIQNSKKESKLDNFDIMMTSTKQPTFSKVYTIIGDNFKMDQIQFYPEYDSQYFTLTTEKTANNTFKVNITPKKPTPLNEKDPSKDGTILKLIVKYTNEDVFATETTWERQSKIEIYMNDDVE